MHQNAFEPKELVDYLFDFSQGVNQGISPLLLPKNQLASAMNVTVRGTLATHRPPYFKRAVIDPDGLLAAALGDGPFQCACYYKPDSGNESLMLAIAGRLFQLPVSGNELTVIERTIPGDPNPATDLQAWLWQSENYIIWNNGTEKPVFFDGTTSVRSNYNTPTSFNTTNTSAFNIPQVGSSVVVPVAAVVNLNVGDTVTVPNRGTFIVNDIAGLNVTFVNLTAGPIGLSVANGTTLSWSHLGTQLPPGRMGVYGLGRNWIALPDGKQFVASDLVGGSSGTPALNYRDAVLNITENLYLAGGGNFTVPGSVGDIQAMHFTATLDVSLGQGPLQVWTPTTVFSCKAPVDRLTWQDVTNPILTESLIANGSESHYATVSANGDTITRSIDGIRSLILGRRDFDTWGNTPISLEVDPQLAKDSEDLLRFASAIVFDNRLLMTSLPVLDDHGIYWRALIPLNFDPISSLRGKAPSVYDATFWSGLNIFQLVTGRFGRVERAFPICFNANTGSIEVYEILKSNTVEIYDNGADRIVWTLESPTLFGEQNPRRQLMELWDGEIYVDHMQGKVDFSVFYKPDQWPCWVPWFAWQECVSLPVPPNNPGFRPRMGLGRPRPGACDSFNGRDLRLGYRFQIKVVVRGSCEFLGGKFKAMTVPEKEYAGQSCTPIDCIITN